MPLDTAMRSEILSPRPARVFRGWAVVTGTFFVLFVAYGMHDSFGVFFVALLDEFGWSRASLSGAFGPYTIAYCLVAFPAGRLTDRWGPRPVIAAGGAFLGVAMLGMALVTRLWQPYLLYGVVAALGMGTAYVPCYDALGSYTPAFPLGVVLNVVAFVVLVLCPPPVRARAAAGRC